jgi:ABC-type uncharacterized transport system substrate-binding protein
VRRREFILALAGAAAAPALLWPLAARAQQKTPTIGFLGPASASAMSAWTAAFVQRLRELGWIEGRSIAIEYRWGDGRADRLSDIAAEFVRLKVDVIVTTGTAVPVLKQATSTLLYLFRKCAPMVSCSTTLAAPWCRCCVLILRSPTPLFGEF